MSLVEVVGPSQATLVEGGLSQVSLMSFKTDLLQVKLSGGDLSWLMLSNTGSASGEGGSSMFNCSAQAILVISWEYEDKSSEGEEG